MLFSLGRTTEAGNSHNRGPFHGKGVYLFWLAALNIWNTGSENFVEMVLAVDVTAVVVAPGAKAKRG